MDKFWVVWAPERNVPKMKHETKEQAAIEAARVAAKERTTVFVLEAIDGYAPSNAIEKIELFDPSDIPF
jgi:hypothetical protein